MLVLSRIQWSGPTIFTTEISKEKKIPVSQAWTHLTDLLRLQIFCKTQHDVMDVFKTIAKWPNELNVLRIKSRLGQYLIGLI